MDDEAPKWLVRRLDRIENKLDRYNGTRARVDVLMWGVGLIYAGVVSWAVKVVLTK